MFSYSNRYEELQKGVQTYPEIRLAVVDSDGRILKISPIFSLHVEGKNLFYDEIDYNFTKNQITGQHTAELDSSLSWKTWKWTGIHFLSIIILATFGDTFADREKKYLIQGDYELLQICFDLSLLVLICHRNAIYFIVPAICIFLLDWIYKKILLSFPNAPKVFFPAFWLICSIPFCQMLFFQYQKYISPYYQIADTQGFQKEIGIWLAICDLPWLLVSIHLWRKFYKSYLQT